MAGFEIKYIGCKGKITFDESGNVIMTLQAIGQYGERTVGVDIPLETGGVSALIGDVHGLIAKYHDRMERAALLAGFGAYSTATRMKEAV